jgi:hypothetical protein
VVTGGQAADAEAHSLIRASGDDRVSPGYHMAHEITIRRLTSRSTKIGPRSRAMGWDWLMGPAR